MMAGHAWVPIAAEVARVGISWLLSGRSGKESESGPAPTLSCPACVCEVAVPELSCPSLNVTEALLLCAEVVERGGVSAWLLCACFAVGGAVSQCFIARCSRQHEAPHPRRRGGGYLA